jgi:hypothetical protein
MYNKQLKILFYGGVLVSGRRLDALDLIPNILK